MTGDLHLDRHVSASAAEIWSACATPRGLEGWCADRVTGTVAPGSTLKLEWPALSRSASLNVVDYVPGGRVGFQSGSTLLVLGVADGTVSLTHSGLTDRDDREGFSASWNVGLSLLAHSLEAHRGKRRRAAWFTARARTTARLAHLYFTQPEALSAWFGRGDGLAEEGADYALTTVFGDEMTGKVLAAAGGRDVAVSWEETGDSVLAFRSLPTPTKDERLLALSWSRWASPVRRGEPMDAPDANTVRIEGELGRCVQRLARVLDRSGSA